MTEIRKLRKTTEDAYLLAEKKRQMLAIRDWMIIDIALSTGLRVSELSKLKEEDLYLKNNESEIIVVNGKGGKSRMVKIDPSLKRHLKKYLQWKRSIDKMAIMYSSLIGGIECVLKALKRYLINILRKQDYQMNIHFTP